jgi:hypothetical protein
MLETRSPRIPLLRPLSPADRLYGLAAWAYHHVDELDGPSKSGFFFSLAKAWPRAPGRRPRAWRRFWFQFFRDAGVPLQELADTWGVTLEHVKDDLRDDPASREVDRSAPEFYIYAEPQGPADEPYDPNTSFGKGVMPGEDPHAIEEEHLVDEVAVRHGFESAVDMFMELGPDERPAEEVYQLALGEGKADWAKRVTRQLPVLLDRLLESEVYGLGVDQSRPPRTHGVYLLTENNRPVYVGRTGLAERARRDREGHSNFEERKSHAVARHSSGTSAYHLTCERFREQGKELAGSRDANCARPEFMSEFRRQRTRVEAMEFRVVEIDDDLVATVFVAYAATVLRVPQSFAPVEPPRVWAQ